MVPSSMIAPGVARDHAVADAAGLQVGEAVRIQAVEELAGVRSAHDQLAERGHVDQTGGLVDGHAPRPAGRRSRRRGASRPPTSRWRRARGGVRGSTSAWPARRAGRRARPSARRARAGARSWFRPPPGSAGLLRHQPHRRQLAHAALARAHRRGRVALGELDRVVALLDREVDVLRGHVLAQAGEALAAALARDRRRHGDGRSPSLRSFGRPRSVAARARESSSPNPSAWAASAPAALPECSADSRSAMPTSSPAA